jgi:preprotein translocase subunit SecA
VILRTIDDKWKDHLYGMDQLREGINLRAYGQKNPLLEYKSEGFKMFQDMMSDMNAVTVQRLFRTQIQGQEQQVQQSNSKVRNMKTSHQDTTGMGFSGSQSQDKSNQPQQVRVPVQAEQKHGRNEKVSVKSPTGEIVEIKFKKLQSYLKKGFSQV